LVSACADDTDLRASVEGLLKAHDKAGDFLESPVFDPDVTLDESIVSEGSGVVIDRYKILEKIGEGGMAVVYMVEQTEPIRRKVALKIIKLGMDTKSVIARFEAERQALAMMDHPNIAKVLDAGATETGRPYFVMELVKGVSITDYCDANSLSTKERMELFIQVCNAVQHAHQKGIIHRDIKPTNVMVTLHDGKPVPKVIDFGIAKAINQKLTEKTLFTRYAHIIGTPAYMSPEQAEMSGLDIDIRTDVFSLGTLLYELLTGSPSFDSEHLLSKSYEEMQRIIREEEPTKPSTKISTMGAALIDIAKLRQTSPENLRKLIRADLDWIVMKTLEKDRNRRYDSVSEFAADIKRYLSNEPVLAGPPSTFYRLRKFIQRRRALVVSTTAVAVVLVIGFVISTSLYLSMRKALNTVSQLEDKFEVYNKLSIVQKLYAEGRSQAALNEIEAMLNSQNLGPEAHLLRARLLVEVGQLKKAEAQLLSLTKAEPGIAGAAHYLLAQVNMGVDETKVKEHEALAASILPDTVEAYALRAMTASSMDQALQWLDRAITLDPAHYPSRKARMLIY
jgi:serine/threonine protein kinase